MRDFFKTVKFKVLMALMAVVIGILIFSLTREGYTSDSASIFSVMFEPFQNFSSKISKKVTSSLDMLFNAEKYYNENEQLRNTLNEVYNDIIDYDKLRRENEELRVLLGLKDEYEDYEFSPPCSVIARNTNDPYGSFTINKGSDDGIKPNYPVITATGLVGVCYEVSSSTSKVRTFYSPRTAIGVTTVQSKATGVMEGDYELAADGLCRVSYISKTAEIAKGDVFFTTGSESFPAGLLVGTVEETGVEDSGLSQYATIKPAIAPETLTDVFVILSFNGMEIAE